MIPSDFDRDALLGLPTDKALSLLAKAGVGGVAIQVTQAPKNPQPQGEERVVAVRGDDTITLIVSRFLTGAPKQA